MKRKLLQFLRHPVMLLSGAGIILLLLVSLDLFAQETGTSSDLRLAESVKTTSPSGCFQSAHQDAKSSAAEASALLPFIPPKTFTPSLTLPGERAPDPNAFKVLYGYRGPYFNTAALDGKVVVLDSSVYTWPTPTWKVSGMLRNQTRCPMQIRSVSARLLGSKRELLGMATATVPVANLRPGEPGPFTIETQLSGGAVKSIEWQVDSASAPSPVRQFEITIDENRLSLDGTEYNLGGIIKNAATATVRGVHVVAAWLDDRNRVISVAEPQFDDHGNLAVAVDLDAAGDESFNDSGVFNYTTEDPALGSRIGHASNLALWGVSK